MTGFPFIFPSLGPTAYLLAVRPSALSCRPRTVVGGHAIGVAGGLVAFSLLAPDVAVTAELPPLSSDGLRLAASGVLATGLTTGGMLATGLRHAPACATTLIVSLGLLSTPPQAAGILLAVVVLVGVHVASRVLGRSLSTISSSAG
ncbi:HPP family protein [Salinibaculum salinum]|uniref:HPP family protein n=1 Tax=Salinibaculum salinum TaxID=3131996 RepID=UPI0030ED5F76